MTILITGYSGFVGRFTLPKLIADGHRVICLGRNLPNNGILCEHVKADLGADGEFPPVPWHEIEVVLHLASAGVKASNRTGPECFRVNVLGTARLLAALEKASRLKKVITTPTFYERAVLAQPALKDNHYIETKYLATAIAHTWARSFPGELSLATLFQAYGPGDGGGNVLNYVASQLKRGEKALLGSGKGLRDWIYIDDVAAALALLVRQRHQNGVKNYDLGSGKLNSLRDVVEQIAQILKVSETLLDFDPSRDRLDVSVALAATHNLPGWMASTAFTQGLKNLIYS